jgi:DNA repair protein RecO (recombination protein O)
VDEAYVLRTQELGEADLIVSLLAERHGKLCGVARSARKSRRRFGGALQPLTRVRVAWSEKQGRELHRLDSLECLRTYADMQADPAVQAACAVVSEISEAFAREAEPDPHSFRLLGSVLTALEGGASIWALIRYFEYWMCRLHGLLPDWAACAVCHRELSSSEARWVVPGYGVCCRTCGARGEGSRRLARRERKFLEAARVEGPDVLAVDPGVAVPGGALEAMLRGTLEQFAERRFRGYRHLRAAMRLPGTEETR